MNGRGWKHHTTLHVKKNSNSNSTPNYPAVNSEETGTSTGAGDTGRCGATESGKKTVCLRIVPVVMKGKDQDNAVVTTRFWILARTLRY